MDFKKSTSIRYLAIVALLVIVGISVIVRAGFLMFVKRGYWEQVANRFVKENVVVKPNRGNILSADGQLMASSLPEYRIYMDFMTSESKKFPARREKDQHRRDTLLKNNINEISEGLRKTSIRSRVFGSIMGPCMNFLGNLQYVWKVHRKELFILTILDVDIIKHLVCELDASFNILRHQSKLLELMPHFLFCIHCNDYYFPVMKPILLLSGVFADDSSCCLMDSYEALSFSVTDFLTVGIFSSKSS